MKPRNAAALLALSLLAVTPTLAHPDGMMLPRRSDWNTRRERALINEPEQKAVVYYESGREQLIISPSYSGAASDFAWVVPVPSRPKVKIVQGALFHELARIVAPEPPRRRIDAEAKSSFGGRAPSAAVRVLERETVGAYDVSVLAASNGRALKNWLDENGYYLPNEAAAPIQHYVEEGWTFVACRVKTPRNARGLRTGTLAPLRLSFPAQQPVYPMRLSSVNPQPFKTLLYFLTPAMGRERGRTDAPQNWQIASGPGANPRQGDHPPITTFPDRYGAPTLARLTQGRLRIQWKTATIRPEDCTQDYRWQRVTHAASVR